MRDFHLRFVQDRWPDGMADLFEDDLTGIPDTSGAYVLGTSDGTDLIYPWGRSPIFYIGKSFSIRKRLLEHRRHTNSAIDDHDIAGVWPRYQYGASFGTCCAWYENSANRTANELEAQLINEFYDIYGSTPVANGTWPTGIPKPKPGKRS